MNPRLTVAAAAALLAAACNQGAPAQEAAASPAAQAAASVAAEASAAASSASAAPGAYLNLPEGFSADAVRADMLPENVAEGDVLLLQYDEARNITVSAVKSPAYEGGADSLADKLKSALAADKSLQNAAVAVEGGQVRFSYEFAGSDPKAAESCIAKPDPAHGLVTVCANGTGTDTAELHALLQGSLK